MRFVWMAMILSVWLSLAQAEPDFASLGTLREQSVKGREDCTFFRAVAFAEVLPNLRFLGRYGPDPHPDFPCHPSIKGNDYPQDALAALIQYLFPSPDGVIVVHNARNGDPIGRLAKNKRFDVLNRLIKLAIFYLKSPLLTQTELEAGILSRFEDAFSADYDALWNGIQGQALTLNPEEDYKKKFLDEIKKFKSWKEVAKIRTYIGQQ